METRDAATATVRFAYRNGALKFPDFYSRYLKAESGDPDAAAAGLQPVPQRTRPGGSHRTYPLDSRVLAELAALTDPVARCVHAGQITADADNQQETARVARLRALACAHLTYDASQVACYSRFGMQRRVFADAIKSLGADIPDFGSQDKAFAEADRQNLAYEAQRSRAETARLVRDAEIRFVTNGAYGEEHRAGNAWIATQIGQSTARIAQVRNTSAPKSRKAA